MMTMRDAAGRVLECVQVSARQLEYEFRAGAEVVGTLRWQKPFGSLALAEVADARWSFKRSGFLRPVVTARPSEAAAEPSMLRPNWRGEGPLFCPGGRSYTWTSLSYWRCEWAFLDSRGETLVRFTPDPGRGKAAAEITLSPSALAVPDLPLLVLFGWYLLVLASEDEEAAAAVIATS